MKRGDQSQKFEGEGIGKVICLRGEVICLRCGRHGTRSQSGTQHCWGWFHVVTDREFKLINNSSSLGRLRRCLSMVRESRNKERRRATSDRWSKTDRGFKARQKYREKRCVNGTFAVYNKKEWQRCRRKAIRESAQSLFKNRSDKCQTYQEALTIVVLQSYQRRLVNLYGKQGRHDALKLLRQEFALEMISRSSCPTAWATLYQVGSRRDRVKRRSTQRESC